MRQVRRCVFETNSSSSHSIVLLKKNGEDYYYTYNEAIEELFIRVDGDGTLELYSDLYFGRSPFAILNTFYKKLLYAYANAGDPESQQSKEVTKTLQELIPDIKRVHLYSKPGTDDYILWGALDHFGITLKEFLINKRYFVVVDGDEYMVWHDLCSSGVVDRSRIEQEYPEY